MSRIAKIYCSKDELQSIAPSAQLIEAYDAFQLVELSPKQLASVGAKIPVEDVTALYQLQMAGRKVNTARPRYSAKGKTMGHPAYQKVRPLPAGKHHYIVQFHGPIKQAWLRQVKKVGAQYRSPYADFACIFRMTAAVLAKVQALSFVRWVGHLKDESRVAAGVLKRRRKPDTEAASENLVMGPDGIEMPGMLVIQFFDGKDLAAAKPKFGRCGATLLSSDRTGVAVVKVSEAPKEWNAAVKALSALHGVRLITRKTVPSTRNNVAPQFMGVAKSVGTISSGGLALTGEGEIIAVADTGLDTGVAQTLSADFAGRVVAIHSWAIDRTFDSQVTNRRADDGAADVSSGHGTHVAGSVLGAGSSGPGGAANIRGLAHKAKLVFQAVEQKMNFASAQIAKDWENDPFQLVGIPDNLTPLFQQAYNEGARIHSNSWGGGRPGEYESTSRELDEFVWKNPDFCVLVAAGNEGVDRNPSDGKVDVGSVSAPGTAKNCITVGASQSERPQFAGNTWGQFWPDDFPRQPLKNQEVAGNHDEMAAFSSRGPTLDERIKPDIVAPGTFILSARSTQLPDDATGWSAYDANPSYMFEGGTSMATPLTAGAVALIRQFFRVKKNLPSPSAALLKATLLCGARRMPLSYVPATAKFDNHQGFGRVDLDKVLSPAGGAVFGFKDQTNGLQTGGADNTMITVTAGRSLRVLLAYSDYPGRGLKNNLNLMLTAPDGTRRVGNAQGNQLTFDTKNNVELIEIPAPAAGNWQVQVIGANVPEGPQPFALVWLA